MDDAGWLGPTRLTAAGREWAAGDRLVCRRNDYRPDVDVRNGTRGTVEHVHLGAGSLVMRTDDGRRVELPADYLEHAHHGYAITGHAAQGITVDRTYLLATPDRGSAEWGYVVASRHRTELRIHTVEAEGGRAYEGLARAWSTGRPKQLAIDVARQEKARSGPTIGRSMHREPRDILEPER
jgi:ATP-dependent exoDNAse (exonuclease V) alpha subunit